MAALELIFASGNAHKAEELAGLFDSNLYKILPAPSKLEVEESGTSFQENAFLKAKAYFDKWHRPIISDDSGLVVKALPDELGIHSARFGGEGLKDQDRTLLLLEKMSKVPEEDRQAYFVCILCIYLSPEEVYFFEGRVEGSIGHEIRGNQGFGYDPAFLPSQLGGKSLAEDPQWKAQNSHRAIAAKFAQDFLKERVCQSR